MQELLKQMSYCKGQREYYSKEVSRLEKLLGIDPRFRGDTASLIPNNSLQPIMVTDHAIVRYCQRVMGIDVKKIKNDILDSVGKKSPIIDFKKLVDGFTFVIRQGKVSTIYKKTQQPKKAKKEKRNYYKQGRRIFKERTRDINHM